MSLLSVENLSFTYCSSENADRNFALSEINFAIEEGSMTLLYGSSGSGKSTLLKLLKPEISPNGKQSGTILFDNSPIDSIDLRISASKIGFVGQDAESRIVTENVLAELAFLPQNLGMTRAQAFRRMAELSAFFDIENLCKRRISTLSAGQKQLVCLAAVMVGSPKLLLLDEPSARLDPHSADSFFQMLNKIRRELGTAIIICEHSTERIFYYCTQILHLENGHQKFCLSPKEAAESLKNSQLFDGLPILVKLSNSLGTKLGTLENIPQARLYLRNNFSPLPEIDLPGELNSDKKNLAVYAKNISFRYEKYSENVIDDMTFSAAYGEITVICGANGAGKTTLLRLLAGILYPCGGSVYIGSKRLSRRFERNLYCGNLAMLTQNPADIMLSDNVHDELLYTPDGEKRTENEIFSVTDMLELPHELFNMHPFDLSGGELQRVALAKLLLLHPKILLLDEPVKGLDVVSKQRLTCILKQLALSGKSIILTTHDLNFAAETADSIALVFGGTVATHEPTVRFLRSGTLFSTAAARISEGIFPDAVSDKRLIESVKKGMHEKI